MCVELSLNLWQNVTLIVVDFFFVTDDVCMYIKNLYLPVVYFFVVVYLPGIYIIMKSSRYKYSKIVPSICVSF